MSDQAENTNHPMTAEQRRLGMVLDRIRARMLSDMDEAAMYAEAFDQMLNDMAGFDAFGTEGQLDPRGDGRDGEWSVVRRVQGVDE